MGGVVVLAGRYVRQADLYRDETHNDKRGGMGLYLVILSTHAMVDTVHRKIPQHFERLVCLCELNIMVVRNNRYVPFGISSSSSDRWRISFMRFRHLGMDSLRMDSKGGYI